MKKMMKYGARKGKMNFFRRWMAKAASRELCIFPVPGSDVLRTYQSESLSGQARLTTNSREANVLLVVGDMSRAMAGQAAIVYAQMPRPRVLVMAGPEHLDPLPHPDVHVTLENDFLTTALPVIREYLSNHSWKDEAEAWRPETLVNKIEEAGQQQGHMHDHGGHDHGHEGHQHGGHEGHDHSAHQHEEHGHGHHTEHASHDHGHNHGGHDHGAHGHGGHDHGSGFMSMIAMTKDLPRSADGLPMEWSDVQFGPFHPGLPGGLCLSMKLDGDTVAEAEADQNLTGRNLLASIPDNPMALPEYLEAVNPMAPVTYRLLAQKALVNFSSEAGNSALTLPEAVLLEKERITSHLNWLAVLAVVLGSDWMRDQAIKHYHRFQNDTGSVPQLSGFIKRVKKMPYLKLKLSVASHGIGETEEHNQGVAGDTHVEHHYEHNADSHSDHCHEEGDEYKPHDHGKPGHEGHGRGSHGSHEQSHEGHEHHHEEHNHSDHQLKDHKQESHEHEHADHPHKEGDESKKHEHHGEHNHSHEMHQHAGHEHHEHVHHDHGSGDEKEQAIGPGLNQLLGDITGPVARAAGIEKDHRLEEAVYQQAGWTPVTATGNNAWSRLMVRLDEIEQSLRFIEKAGNDSGSESSQKINIPSIGMGNGIAHIESPRGKVTLKFHIHEGKLAHVHLASPSAALAGLVKPITEQQELADALTAVTSLDISPWEINP